MQRTKSHTTAHAVFMVAVILTTAWQFISRRMHAKFRRITERCRNWLRNHKRTSDTDDPGRTGTGKMNGSRGSRAQNVPEVVIVDDGVDNHIFAASANDEDACRTQVLSVLDDICPSHLDILAKEHAYDAQLILSAIMEKQEKGEDYPRRSNPLKRKWEGDSDDDSDAEAKDKGTATLQAKIDDPLYAPTMSSPSYKNFAVTLLSQDFAMAPKPIIKRLLSENGSVLRTYTAMDDARRAGNDADNRMWVDKKHPTPALPEYASDNIAALPRNDLSGDELAALDEFLAARASRDRKDAVLAEEAKELANIEQAKSKGEMGECGCCFDDVPSNRMVHCAGETAHSFCRNCMKQQAAALVGQQKYELTCMATEGCDAGFSIGQREAFLDKKLKMALDRIEQQAMLDMAGLEDLETCPFCPYAMEYPPVEVNKEFRCENPSCHRVSCRLCRKPTHIPRSCAEAAQDEAQDARHTIEEAMSEAMIRKCNKCRNPFIKHDGCNKIFCTRCNTIQCYICRQTVTDYSHFNDATRGGKPGQCPLFDATEERHQHEVQRAEEEMRKKVMQERPDLIGDALNLKVSSRVEADERKRKEREAARAAAHRRYRNANAANAHVAPEIRRHNPEPPNVLPRPEDARGARDPAWAQPPAVADAPLVQRPAPNPNPAADLPFQFLQHRQQQAALNRQQQAALNRQRQAEAWRAARVGLERRWNPPVPNPVAFGQGVIGHGGNLIRQSLDREQIPAFHGRYHLHQAAWPQPAHPPAAWPQENQSEAARLQALYFPELGALAGPARPPGQPLNVQLQPPLVPWAQQPQQPQQNPQSQQMQGLGGPWHQAAAHP